MATRLIPLSVKGLSLALGGRDAQRLQGDTIVPRLTGGVR